METLLSITPPHLPHGFDNQIKARHRAHYEWVIKERCISVIINSFTWTFRQHGRIHWTPHISYQVRLYFTFFLCKGSKIIILLQNVIINCPPVYFTCCLARSTKCLAGWWRSSKRKIDSVWERQNRIAWFTHFSDFSLLDFEKNCVVLILL